MSPRAWCASVVLLCGLMLLSAPFSAMAQDEVQLPSKDLSLDEQLKGVRKEIERTCRRLRKFPEPVPEKWESLGLSILEDDGYSWYITMMPLRPILNPPLLYMRLKWRFVGKFRGIKVPFFRSYEEIPALAEMLAGTAMTSYAISCWVRGRGGRGSAAYGGAIVFGLAMDLSSLIHNKRLPEIEARRQKELDLLRRRHAFLVTHREKLVKQQRALPCDLLAEADFDDSSSRNPNNMLDAKETAAVVVGLENRGVGAGYAVELYLDSDNRFVQVQGGYDVGDVPPGARETVRLPIQADLDAPDGTVTITIETKEKRGYDARPIKLRIPVARLDKPVLEIASVDLNDGSGLAEGNGNGIPENNERIELVALVRNRGMGVAQDVSVKLVSINSGLTLVRKEDRLSSILPGRTERARFSFEIPRLFRDSKIRYRLEAEDGMRMSRTVQSFEKSFEPLESGLVETHELIDANQNGVVEKGEWVRLSVRVRNDGGLDARDVAVKVGVPKKWVEFQDEKLIGTLLSGESQTVSFDFLVKGRTEVGDLPVYLTVNQSDGFKGIEKNFTYEVKEMQAEVEVVQGERQGRIPMVTADVSVPPVIVIASPSDNEQIIEDKVTLSGRAADDKGVDLIKIWLNGQPLEGRGIKVKAKPQDPRHRAFQAVIPLRDGPNTIRVVAYDTDDLKSEQTITVIRTKEKGEIWAVVIGISDYLHVRDLKYTDDDARAFYNYLVHTLDVPSDHIWSLYDGQATVRQMRSVLGTQLRRKARKNDTVIIYFAGHGAPEEDVESPDGDGLEKYILPYDADPEDLYSTALPMRDISDIFQRIKAERLVFIADACYSGASGGRTILSSRRATLSGSFLDRLSKGRGRVILTASDANEVSKEEDRLGHGVFTYYLLEGLRGKADYDKDGDITVDEVYRYVSKKVPDATGQSQNPVKKGEEVVGQIILGRVK